MEKKKNKNIKKKLKRNFLLLFLKNIKKNSLGNIENNLSKIEILKNLQNSSNYKINGDLSNIKKILDQTIKYGIIPFSILARHGFIAKDNLLSLLNKNVINEIELTKFEKSISTITSEFLEDQKNLDKLKNYREFMEKYGHLRAGTYDISSNCYSELNKSIFIKNKKNNLNIKQKKFKFSKNILSKINSLLKKNNISLSSDELLDYFKKSISSREYAKFIFTKGISVILQNIKIFAKKTNLN